MLFSRLHIDPAPPGPCANRGRRDGGCRACFHTVLAALGRRAGETGTAVGSLPRDTLIVSPGLSVPQQVPRAFQPVSLSTEIPLKTCSRSPCSEAVTLGATSPREQKSLCVRLQPGQEQGLWGSHSRPASKRVRCSWCCSSECTYKLSLFNKQHKCFPGPHAELYSKYICTNINF